MPTSQDPDSGFAEKKATGIYIARGEETLGPYNPAEAAALIVGGYLYADDYAARNGDTAWVPLADFLPPSLRPKATSGSPAARTKRPDAPSRKPPSRGQQLTVIFFLLATVPWLVMGGIHWFEGRRAAEFTAARPSPTPGTVAATRSAPTPTVANPTPPPTPEPDGPLHGSLAVPLAGVRIMAYPLDTLEVALAPTVAAAQAAHERLDPPIAAAAEEHTTRAAEETAAFRTLNAAAPNDPLRSSLRFAYNGAKTATRTAADNERFLRDELAGAAGGERFFHALPTPALTTETDAAGTFTLDLPTDGHLYAVAASVRQTADDGTTRTLRWIVRLSVAQWTGHAPLRLDDGNSLSSASEDSLVHAAD